MSQESGSQEVNDDEELSDVLIEAACREIMRLKRHESNRGVTPAPYTRLFQTLKRNVNSTNEITQNPHKN